jgi:hypothetical protein
MANFARYQSFAVDSNGNALASPSVEVRRESDNGLATLYSDRTGATPIGNPFTGDADGYFAFHVVGGAYKVVVTQGAVTRTLRYVGVGTASENDLGVVPGSTFVVPPQGRLTLTTNTPVPISDVAAATTMRYTPANGVLVPVWDGVSAFALLSIGGELTQAASDTSKSPAAVANNSNYDMFVWNDAGTMRCTRGPAWSSDTSRGTGAGTTELVSTLGILINAQNITNGPTGGKGTYVGTVRSNGTATFDMTFGTSAAGGGPARLCVWNAYNQARVRARVQDSNASWSTTSAFRNVDNSSSMRISFVSGLAEHAITCEYGTLMTLAAVADTYGANALALDATGFDFFCRFMTPTAHASTGQAIARGVYGPQLGFHFIQAIEGTDTVNSVTFLGGASQSPGLVAEMFM